MNLALAAEPVLLRTWQEGDEALLADAAEHLSPTSLYKRFFVGTGGLPRAYLPYIVTSWRRGRWDAVLAIRDGKVIGWAEYVRGTDDPAEADLAVIVVDAWQHRGLGSALVRMLLDHCVHSGVAVLQIDVLVFNRVARQMIRSLFGEDVPARRDGDVLHYTVRTGALAGPDDPRHRPTFAARAWACRIA